MDRREFLTSTSAVTAATATLAVPIAAAAAPDAATPAAPHIAASARTLRIALPQSIVSLTTGMTSRRLAHRLQSALSDGARVEIVPTGETGIDTIRSAAADAYYGLASDLAPLHPAFAVFAGLPSGEHMDASEQHAWLAAADGAELWHELSAAFGLRAFAGGHTGASRGLYTDRVLEQARDVAGLRIACRGLARDVAAALGATPVDIDESALNGGLSALGLDAAEPLGTMPKAVAQWSYAPGLMPAGMSMSLVFRAEAFAQFSRQEQIVIEAVAAESRAHDLALASLERASLTHVAHMRQWPISTDMPKQLEADIAAAASAVVDRIASTDPLASRIVASHRNFRAAIRARSPIIA